MVDHSMGEIGLQAWDHSLTYTCNQKNHFGTASIQNWIDCGEWKKHLPGFDDLEDDKKGNRRRHDRIFCRHVIGSMGKDAFTIY
eukprot:331885-Ditylum_brightwellii.AAC.1